MDASKRPRFAIFFAPSKLDPLWALGAAWLGRDARSGYAVARPDLPGGSAERLAAVTEAPAFYGFHATLKAPFFLKKGLSLGALEERCGRIAAEMEAVPAVVLEVSELDRFLALRPPTRSVALHSLAATCVESFDDLREPLNPEVRQRYMEPGLTEVQAALLDRWGYPYVMEEFRFHITLTSRLSEPERAEVGSWARDHFGPALVSAVTVDGISLFAQPDGGAPFREIGRYPLGAR
ncbi:MAG: DUF1045 domain-containing protein [Kiloniellales bacterium]|nr:DUF1045 domain-containing protein [Kiloniellales bacterium]